MFENFIRFVFCKYLLFSVSAPVWMLPLLLVFSIIYYSKKVLHHLIFTTFLINVLYKYTKNIF